MLRWMSPRSSQSPSVLLKTFRSNLFARVFISSRPTEGSLTAQKRFFGCSATSAEPEAGSGSGVTARFRVLHLRLGLRIGWLTGHRLTRFRSHQVALGKQRERCLPADLLSRAFLVSSVARVGLPHRILLLLESDRRLDRSRRHSARGALVRRTAKSVRGRSVPNLPYALLVQRQRSLFALVVRSRSGIESVAHSANRAGGLSASAVDPLSLAERGGPGLYELPMGLPAFGSWISQHLPGAIPAPSVATLSKSRFLPGRIFCSFGSCSGSCSCPAW